MLCLQGKRGVGNESRPLWGRFQWKGWLLFCGYWGNETSTGAYTMSERKKFKASMRRVLSYSKALLIRFQSQLLCLDTNVQVNTSFQTTCSQAIHTPSLVPAIHKQECEAAGQIKWMTSFLRRYEQMWTKKQTVTNSGCHILPSFLLLGY